MHKNVNEKYLCHEKGQLWNIVRSNFTIEYFLLLRKATKTRNELAHIWKGPLRISGVQSKHVEEAQNIIIGKKESVHSLWMIFYRKKDYKPIDDELQKFAEHSESQYKIVGNIENIIDGEKELWSNWNGKAFQMSTMLLGNL